MPSLIIQNALDKLLATGQSVGADYNLIRNALMSAPYVGNKLSSMDAVARANQMLQQQQDTALNQYGWGKMGAPNSPNFTQYSQIPSDLRQRNAQNATMGAAGVAGGDLGDVSAVGKTAANFVKEAPAIEDVTQELPRGIGSNTPVIPNNLTPDPLAKFKQPENLVKTDPIMQVKKSIPVTTVQGEKTVIEAGEALTPYELKGGKYLLKDGTEMVVNKNQYQNIKGNALKAEAKPFAPELEQTTETVRGMSKRALEIDKETSAMAQDRLPDNRMREEARWHELVAEKESLLEKSPKFENYTLPGGNNYREILIQAPGAGKTDPRTGFTTNADENAFISSHWDEPNVLAHVRLNDRTYNGKPVTFIEEIQSDWARAARKPTTTQDMGEQLRRSAGTTESLPNHPLLKNWQELAVKRALKDAVDNGSEYLAWTTGEQQAARYDLSKQVKNIWWSPTNTPAIGEKGVYIEPINQGTIRAQVDKNGIVTEGNRDWIGKKITDVVGKGIGEKIIADSKGGEVSGEGLKIGGEWADNLYDRQLPNIIEKLTGQKPEMMDMGLEISATKPIQEFKLNTPNGLSDAITSTKQIKVGDRVYHAGGTYKVNKIVNENTFIGTGMTGIDQPQRTFNVSRPKSPGQMGIKLTPEVKAKVRGEAPPVKQPSGVNPFAGNNTPMFPNQLGQLTGK